MPSTKEIRLKIKKRAEHAQDHQGDGNGRRQQDAQGAGARCARRVPDRDRIRNIVAHLALAIPSKAYVRPPRSEIRNVGVILVSTDRACAAGLNTNIQRAACCNRSSRVEANGVKFQATAIGNKGSASCTRLNANVVSHVVQLGDKPHLEKLIGPGQAELDAYARAGSTPCTSPIRASSTR